MGKIVAIGGGEMRRQVPETLQIDIEIVNLSGKSRPRFLFIPTASSDSEDYYNVVAKHYGNRLGCITNVLYLIKNKPTKNVIEDTILGSDIIYVGGGNTLMMMNLWRRLGVDKVLKKAYERDIVLCGMSAGSICWFRQGNSDSRRFKNPKADLIKVTGLGFIDALHCPHYDGEKDRRPQLKKMMKKTQGVAIAIDDCCALEIVDGKYRVIDSKPTANAYKVYWKREMFFEKTIEKSKEFKLVNLLLEK